MSTWKYGIVKRQVHGETWYGIHEVFDGITETGERIPDKKMWTQEPVAVEAETIEELKRTLVRMYVDIDVENPEVIEDVD